MIWVTWRQYRILAIAALALFCVLALTAIGIGSWMRAVFNTDGIGGCLASSGGAGCAGIVSAFTAKFTGGPIIPLVIAVFTIPGMFGATVGAPLLGRELEQGTWRLAWSQTVPRTRWLLIKLALVTAALVVLGAATTTALTWFDQPLDRVGSNLAIPAFEFEGVVFTCSLLCSFGLAVLAGLLLRNTIGAMVAAYFAWEVPTAVVALLNGPIRIPSPATLTVPCRSGCPGDTLASVPPVTGRLGDLVIGLTRSGNQLIVSYIPASRFWTLQLIAGGLYLVVAAAALGAAVWLLHRRTT